MTTSTVFRWGLSVGVAAALVLGSTFSAHSEPDALPRSGGVDRGETALCQLVRQSPLCLRFTVNQDNVP